MPAKHQPTKTKTPAKGKRTSKRAAKRKAAGKAGVPTQVRASPAAGAKAFKGVLQAVTAKTPKQASAVTSITPFLWFDSNCHEAARYYVELFPGSSIDGLHPMGGSFTLAGQRFMGLNGGPMYKFSPAVSFFVICRDQREVDRLWNRLEGDGGKPSRCGWIDDKFGLTWQVIPQAFIDLTSGADPKRSAAVFQAMMGMVKLDVKGLQAAYDAA